MKLLEHYLNRSGLNYTKIVGNGNTKIVVVFPPILSTRLSEVKRKLSEVELSFIEFAKDKFKPNGRHLLSDLHKEFGKDVSRVKFSRMLFEYLGNSNIHYTRSKINKQRSVSIYE